MIACALAACFETPSADCGDLFCTPGTVCSEKHGRCVDPEQLTACEGVVEGTLCTLFGAEARCTDGLCVPLTCGDGVVFGWEYCDGDDLGDVTDCTDLGYYYPGALACGDDCRFDTAGCSGFCGDGEINGPEQCDGAPPDDANCADWGAGWGTVTCSPACEIDRSNCRLREWSDGPSDTAMD